MISLLLILTVLNTIGMGVILYSKFKEKFVILDIDTYTALAEYWQENHDDDGNEVAQERAGGCGFFKECIDDNVDEDEEEEEE